MSDIDIKLLNFFKSMTSNNIFKEKLILVKESPNILQLKNTQIANKKSALCLRFLFDISAWFDG